MVKVNLINPCTLVIARIPIQGCDSPTYTPYMHLTTGDLVDDFTAITDKDLLYHFSEDHGHWRVVFFFPRPSGTHCQMQARRYQALSPEFQSLNVKILGVSSDTRPQHKVFRYVCQLDFALLSDADYKLSEQFGVLEELEPGDDVCRPRRETFLIAPSNRVVHHWTEVNPDTDAERVLSAVRYYLG